MAGENAHRDANFSPVQLGIDGDGNIRMIKIDKITDALLSIPYEHHEIHEGDSFIVCDVQNIDTTTQKWLITTPNTTKYAHIIFDIEATGEVDLKVLQGSDRAGVTALANINRRRVGTPTSGTVLVHRTTSGGTTDGATTIEHKRVGATGVGSKTIAAGGSRGLNEYILKPNTKYVVLIETFANIYVSMCLDWYEHQDTN